MRRVGRRKALSLNINSSITPLTRVFALLGDPVEHSFSPTIQNAAMRELQLDAVYVALRCTRAHLRGLMRGLADAGGGGNVTIPHKRAAAAALDRATERVEVTGACNTFWRERGKLVGDNTDVFGFAAAVKSVLPSVAGADVLLLGAGGAARAAVYALTRERAQRIVILNRTPERARELKRRFGKPVELARAASELRNQSFDLMVSAKPAGKVSRTLLQRSHAVIDLAYGPDGSELVHAARELGKPAVDGLEMLIQQAAVSFELWFKRPAPIDAMRSAIALARRRAR